MSITAPAMMPSSFKTTLKLPVSDSSEIHSEVPSTIFFLEIFSCSIFKIRASSEVLMMIHSFEKQLPVNLSYIRYWGYEEE